MLAIESFIYHLRTACAEWRNIPGVLLRSRRYLLTRMIRIQLVLLAAFTLVVSQDPAVSTRWRILAALAGVNLFAFSFFGLARSSERRDLWNEDATLERYRERYL